MTFAASAAAAMYRCPGEEYDITRSVHLARLSAFYSKCRNCVHASDAADFVDAAILEQAGLPAGEHAALFNSEGVRGRYLNDLTRATAAKITGAMASCLWDDLADPEPAPVDSPEGEVLSSPTGAYLRHSPVRAAAESASSTREPEGIRLLATGRPGPCVVLAHDERPSSPDIVTGAGQALRRMGCQVVDIGLATRPGLLFAIDHLGAVAAVHVTGSGGDPGWTGLDFLMRGNVPCSAPGALERIAARFHEQYSRPSRRPGSQRPFQAAVPYEASLWKHFHALRPLKISLACPSPALRDVFTRIFRKLACRLLPIATPTRRRDSLDRTDPDLERTSRHVRTSKADLGVLVEDDGERCLFFDEQGQFVAPPTIAHLLAPEKTCRRPFAEKSLAPLPFATRESITRAMREQASAFAADGAGRCWFAEAYPVCDAILTVAHLLQCLSRSDRPFSEVVGHGNAGRAL